MVESDLRFIFFGKPYFMYHIAGLYETPLLPFFEAVGIDEVGMWAILRKFNNERFVKKRLIHYQGEWQEVDCVAFFSATGLMFCIDREGMSIRHKRILSEFCLNINDFFYDFFSGKEYKKEFFISETEDGIEIVRITGIDNENLPVN